jgi:hypothetical protein
VLITMTSSGSAKSRTMIVASGILPKIISLALLFTSHVVSSWCSSQKLQQLRGRIALG